MPRCYEEKAPADRNTVSYNVSWGEVQLAEPNCSWSLNTLWTPARKSPYSLSLFRVQLTSGKFGSSLWQKSHVSADTSTELRDTEPELRKIGRVGTMTIALRPPSKQNPSGYGIATDAQFSCLIYALVLTEQADWQSDRIKLNCVVYLPKLNSGLRRTP